MNYVLISAQVVQAPAVCRYEHVGCICFLIPISSIMISDHARAYLNETINILHIHTCAYIRICLCVLSENISATIDGSLRSSLPFSFLPPVYVGMHLHCRRTCEWRINQKRRCQSAIRWLFNFGAASVFAWCIIRGKVLCTLYTYLYERRPERCRVQPWITQFT